MSKCVVENAGAAPRGSPIRVCHLKGATMPKHFRSLNQITIPRPCNADWDEMIGNDQVRFCEHCNLEVTNLSNMTRAEAMRIVTQSRGGICVRFIVRANGEVLTQKMPERLYLIGRRVSRIAAGAFTATLSLSSAAAQTRSTATAQPEKTVELVNINCERESVADDFSASVSGTVKSSEGELIAGATVILVDRESGEERTTTS